MKYLHEVLSVTAKQYPSNTAVISPKNCQISYSNLQEIVEKTSCHLNSLTIGKGDRVGILSTKRLEAMGAIFGILHCGAAYVPFDAEAPVKRNLRIIDNCETKLLFIDENLLAIYEKDLNEKHSEIDFSSLDGMHLYLRKDIFLSKIQQPEDLAIILYTSGSTGSPKGVMITHQNALSFIQWADNEFKFSEADVFASIAPFHFDLSVFDIYVAFLNGARLKLLDAPTARNPRMISSLIDQHHISVWYSTPSLLKLMLDFGKLERFEHKSLRYVLFAGEVFPISSFMQLKQAWPKAVFFNLYGPTETNVVTFYKIPDLIDSKMASFPIGKPCTYAETKVVDPQGSKSNNNEGELWISGGSVSSGYWKHEPKSGTVFETESTGKIWYKTGDWVSVDESGNYHFIGREDRMVKRKGFRIELAEIEKALHEHPDIMAVAVIPKKTLCSIEICAYFQQKRENKPLGLIELKEHCMKFIPKYMLPDKFIPMSVIPFTSTHKVDYQSLQRYEFRSE